MCVCGLMSDYTASMTDPAVIYSRLSEEFVAKDRLEVSARWTGALGFEAKNPAGSSVHMDSLPDGVSPTPMEMVLMALAGCTGMDIVSILEKKRQPAESIEIHVRGMRAEDHPRGFTDIELEYVLSGPRLTAEAAARAIELSIEKYCSVGGMLAKAATLRTSFRIVPGEKATHE
jgi:putative redox protein